MHRDVRSHLKLFIVVCAACSSKSSEPAKGSAAPPPAPAPEPARAPKPAPPPPVDLPAAGVSKLVVRPTTDPNNRIEVEWNALARAATVVCREDAYNLVSFDTGDSDGLPKGTHDLVWHPQPFVTPPTACEVRFHDEHRRVIARACYHDGRLDPTGCPGGLLPPPKMPDPVQGISVEGSTLHVDGKSVDVTALVTKIADMPERTVKATLTCDGIRGTLVDDTMHFNELADGDTVFARFSFDMAKPAPSHPQKCQLDFTDPKKLATFCIAEGSTNPGPCPT
jgi:hypothetical protein